MITVKIKTTDSKVWNQQEVYATISHAIFTNQNLTIDFLKEGPAFDTLGIDEYIRTLRTLTDYSATITINTSNMAEEDHANYQVVRTFPFHLVRHSLGYQYTVEKISTLKHFGLFVGRNNSPRLYLSSYLHTRYNDLILHSNHLDLEKEFYAANLDIERLILEYKPQELGNIVNYIKMCPIAASPISMDKSLQANHAQQLLQQDQRTFLEQYNKFAIEIAAETYFSGSTFFPTEKTWRPILLMTPFIVQGPTGFLKRLKKMGFRTFSDYWDEGYDEDPYPWSMMEIIKVIDSLAAQSQETLYDMICDMKPILEHNHQCFLDFVKNPRLYIT